MGPLIWYDSAQVRLWILLNFNYNYFPSPRNVQELGNILGTQTARRDAVNSMDNWYTNVGYFPVFISLYLSLPCPYVTES